ncbi:MAG: hypothetical protein RL681_855 [Candidatus Parcubacteria bacterium]|jgi:RNA polymerase sigma factor (sigma-70 family)
MRADEWYFTELKRQSLDLSAQEQRELLDRYRATGDLDARDRLLRSVYRLIIDRARRFAARERLWDLVVDIAQEGVLGAMKALEAHDGRTSMKYSTYAVWWMRSYMQLLKNFQVSTIHLPARRVMSERQALTDGTKPAVLLPRTVSLSEPQPGTDGSEPRTIEDSIGIADDQIERVAQREVRDEFVQSLKRRFGADCANVVVARLGLDGRGCRTHEEIARVRGKTKQAVHQMIHRACKRYPRLQIINAAVGRALSPSPSSIERASSF